MPDGTLNRGEDLGVLLHVSRPRWAIGNATFRETAHLLGEGKSVDQAGRILASRHDLDMERAMRDVRFVAHRLRSHGLLDETETTSPVRIPTLRELFIHVTHRCNLTCSHCYSSRMPEGDLPFRLFGKIVDDMVEMGGRSITLTGGEPLLHPDFKDLLDYGARRCSVSLLTNGTLVDGELARFLSGLGDVRIQVSIDGSGEDIHDAVRGRGSFVRAIRGIELLLEAGLGERLTLAATVMARNLPDLPGIAGLAAKLGVPRVRFMPLRNEGRARERWDMLGASVDEREYEMFFDRMRDAVDGNLPALDVACGPSGFMPALPEAFPEDGFWCRVGTQLIVTPRGDAIPCVLLQGEQFALGNVFPGRAGPSDGIGEYEAGLRRGRGTERKDSRVRRLPLAGPLPGGMYGRSIGGQGEPCTRGAGSVTIAEKCTRRRLQA